MGKEIERKFLVNAGEWETLDKPHPKLYRQGYFVTNPGKSIRIRFSDKNSYLTIKSEPANLSRSEFEYKIPDTDALELLDHFCDAELEKHRYIIFHQNKRWEVDVFLNDNEGLIMAEIELEEADETFDLPSWIEKEVTGNEKYYNASLVTNPFKKWPSSYH